MEFLEVEDEIKDYLSPVIDSLDTKIDNEHLNSVNVGSFVIFDFGIAEVKEKVGMNLKVSYVASNAFDTGIIDEVPKVFLKKELTKQDYLKIFNKYYDSPMKRYTDKKYLEFYSELMKN